MILMIDMMYTYYGIIEWLTSTDDDDDDDDEERACMLSQSHWIGGYSHPLIGFAITDVDFDSSQPTADAAAAACASGPIIIPPPTRLCAS